MRLSPPVRAAAQRLALPMLVFVSAALMIIGKGDVVVVDKARAVVDDAFAPVLEMISAPLASVSHGIATVEDIAAVYRENQELREENQRLLQWQEAARRLSAENHELRDLTKLVPDQPASAVTARVVADSGGAFLRNLLVDAGSQDGVARGQAALTGEGLIGRVSEVGTRTARVLLLTDLNSHIPVTIEGTNARAVLDGDNSDQPRLEFVEAKAQLQPGDRIVTSGTGGVFPPGLPVGVVATTDGGVIRVAPYAALARLDIVRLVDYGLGGVLPQSAVPPPKAPRAAKKAAPKETAE